MKSSASPDPRWQIGPRFLRLRTDANRAGSQKVGIANRQGWAAYHRNGHLFVKRYDWNDSATYPDFGVNTEAYTAGAFVELETLGALVTLAPGGAATHEERWFMFRDVEQPSSDDALQTVLAPHLTQTPHELLKEQYSAIEETRADLVALYFLPDPKLVELGLVPAEHVEQIVLAEYEQFARGVLVQLRRVRVGESASGSSVIDEGVSEGERIVVEGVQKISDGMHVAAQAAPQATASAADASDSKRVN